MWETLNGHTKIKGIDITWKVDMKNQQFSILCASYSFLEALEEWRENELAEFLAGIGETSLSSFTVSVGF